MTKHPIIVMSFNRPDYLDAVLRSLHGQADGVLDGREIHLFQDEGFNPYSYRLYAKRAEIDACVEVFQRWFPKGVVHRASHNLSVALNRWRAESYAFVERGFDAAYFLEDDLVLQPHYVGLLDRMTEWALATGGIAYLSGYCRNMESLEQQLAREEEVGSLGQVWGVSLLRSAWLAMRPHIERYLAIVRDTDYRYRHHYPIFQLYGELGHGAGGSSQDSMHMVSSVYEGLISLSTVTVHGRYVGERGVHQHPKRFQESGFAQQVMLPHAPRQLDFPSAEERARILNSVRKRMQQWAKGGMLEKMQQVIEPRTWNQPNDPVSRAMVIGNLLAEEPPSAALDAKLAALPTLEAMVDRLLLEPAVEARYAAALARQPAPSNSPALDDRNKALAIKILTRSLLPGRRPDAPEVIALGGLSTITDIVDAAMKDEGFALRYELVRQRAAGRGGPAAA